MKKIILSTLFLTGFVQGSDLPTLEKIQTVIESVEQKPTEQVNANIEIDGAIPEKEQEELKQDSSEIVQVPVSAEKIKKSKKKGFLINWPWSHKKK